MEISFAKMNGDFNRVAKIICAAIQRSGELDLSSMSEKEKYNRLISSITQWIRDEESIMKVLIVDLTIFIFALITEFQRPFGIIITLKQDSK